MPIHRIFLGAIASAVHRQASQAQSVDIWDNVILQRENATAVFPISFAHLRQVYRRRSTNTKRATLRTARPFRCRLKATVPKA